MIFVTVGTHEQPFDRLVKCIDRLAEEKIVGDGFVIQTGFSRYIPKFCEYSRFFPYSDMTKFMENARIVVTHGGPSQADFVRNFSLKYKNIISAESDEEIKASILHYDDIIKDMPNVFVSNNEEFTRNIERLAMELLK